MLLIITIVGIAGEELESAFLKQREELGQASIADLVRATSGAAGY